jgi:hypothetical protein
VKPGGVDEKLTEFAINCTKQRFTFAESLLVANVIIDKRGCRKWSDFASLSHSLAAGCG